MVVYLYADRRQYNIHPKMTTLNVGAMKLTNLLGEGKIIWDAYNSSQVFLLQVLLIFLSF
jgi:hypothetical protein